MAKQAKKSTGLADLDPSSGRVLPDDALANLFSLLDTATLVNCLRTCKYWNVRSVFDALAGRISTPR